VMIRQADDSGAHEIVLAEHWLDELTRQTAP
jgi:hypothetical protein